MNVFEELRKIRAAISRIERRQPRARRDRLEDRSPGEAARLDDMDCDIVIRCASAIKRRDG